MVDKRRAPKGSSSEENEGISRRDFIKRALITTAYVVPAIATFSAKDLMAQCSKLPPPPAPPHPVKKPVKPVKP